MQKYYSFGRSTGHSPVCSLSNQHQPLEKLYWSNTKLQRWDIASEEQMHKTPGDHRMWVCSVYMVVVMQFTICWLWEAGREAVAELGEVGVWENQTARVKDQNI